MMQNTTGVNNVFNHSEDTKTIPTSDILNEMDSRFEEMENEESTFQQESEKTYSENQEITGEYLLNLNVEHIPCILGEILPKVGLVCLAGGSDTGKSSFLRDLAIKCVSQSTHFLGFPLMLTHHSVVYVSSEDDQNATAYLLRRQAGKDNSHKLRNLRFVFDTYNLLEVLEQMLSSSPADIIIVDCFADSFGSDLKDSQRIRMFLNQFQQLAMKHQCLVLFLHHTAKRTESFEPSKNNLLSGQGFEAKMRLVMELRPDLMNPEYRHLCIVKGNYLGPQYKRESFVLKFDEETFTFANTGERTPFELLAKSQDDGGKQKYEQAKELKEKGFSYEKIAKMMGYKSKGSVSKLFDKAEKSGWNN